MMNLPLSILKHKIISSSFFVKVISIVEASSSLYTLLIPCKPCKKYYMFVEICIIDGVLEACYIALNHLGHHLIDYSCR